MSVTCRQRVYAGTPVSVADFIRRQFLGNCNADPRQPLESQQLKLNWLAVTRVWTASVLGEVELRAGLLTNNSECRGRARSVTYNSGNRHKCSPQKQSHARLMALCPGPKWAGTGKVKPIWILLKQETVSGSGISWAICKSVPRSRQKTTPAPHHSVFYRPDALHAAQATASKH